MKRIFKSLFLILLIFFSIQNSFGQDAKIDVYNFFIDILFFESKGISSRSDIRNFTGITKMPSIILGCTKWNDGCQCGSLFDYYLPEYAGFLDSFVAYNSVDADIKWINDFFDGTIKNFIVSRPKILDDSQKKINEIMIEDQQENNQLETLIESNKIDTDLENVNIVERRLRNSNNMLSLYTYGDEVFKLQKTDDGYIKVISNKNKIKRQYYDEKMRLLKREFWDFTGGISNSKKVKTELYEYETSLIPVSSKILEDNMRFFLKYDSFGHIVESLNYNGLSSLELDSENLKKDDKINNKFVLDSKTTWKYSEKGNVLEKYYITYEYKSSSSSIIIGKKSKKDVYEYKIEEGQPDYFYYENDILRLKTIFNDINSYVTTSFFDGDFIVESYYIDSKHVKDLYYMKGRLRRTVLYD